MNLWKTIVVGSALCVAARAQVTLPGPAVPEELQYQKNSVLAQASIDGEENHLGNVPIAALKWLNEPAVVSLRGAPGLPRFLAISRLPVVSRAEGAWVSPHGQLFNLDLGDPTLRLVPLGEGHVFPVRFEQPLTLSMQLVVLTDQHPDGFVLSAPLLLNYEPPKGMTFTIRVPDLQHLERHPFEVMVAPTMMVDPDVWQSQAETGPTTTATATLFVEGVPVGSEQLTLDNSDRSLRMGSSEVQTLRDIFPTASGANGKIVITFAGPVTVTVGGQANVLVEEKTYVTDKGCAIETFMDGAPGRPDLTQAQNDAALCGMGLKGMVTQTMAPSDAYDCHGFTFTCGLKWINDDQVAKILADNGYTKNTGASKVGDIVVYMNGSGGVTHSGNVTKVDAMGNPTEIESKWGRMAKYKHAPDKVPPTYGTPMYYSTTRCLGNKLKCKAAVQQHDSTEVP